MTTIRHFGFTAALVIALGTSSTAVAQTATRTPTGRLVLATVHSTALDANRLGDPADQPVAIYLPPGYRTSTTRRFPTLYLLHGYGGKPDVWITNGYQGMSLRSVMDSLIRTRAI